MSQSSKLWHCNIWKCHKMSQMSHFFKSLVQSYVYLLCLDPARNDSYSISVQANVSFSQSLSDQLCEKKSKTMRTVGSCFRLPRGDSTGSLNGICKKNAKVENFARPLRSLYPKSDYLLYSMFIARITEVSRNSRQKMGWHRNCRARSLSARNARPL